jgi:hypothetical protein
LREALHWTQRNSDLGVWFEIARWLRDRGEEIVFVRDTEKGDLLLGHGWDSEPLASKDIKCRAALYANAKFNLFISNGPATLDWFCGDTPSLTFIPLSKTDGYKCADPDWWPANHGINAGEQFPFFKGTKKSIVWEYPSFEVVTQACEDLFAKRKKRAA